MALDKAGSSQRAPFTVLPTSEAHRLAPVRDLCDGLRSGPRRRPLPPERCRGDFWHDF